MFCEEWFLRTSFHLKGFVGAVRLTLAETAQLLVKTASGLKGQWALKSMMLDWISASLQRQPESKLHTYQS